MSHSMENRKQYSDERFVLVRKDMEEYYDQLCFVSKRKAADYEEDKQDLVVEGFYEKIPNGQGPRHGFLFGVANFKIWAVVGLCI